MGKLVENELTKMLLDTMDEFRRYDILESFLNLLKIPYSSEDGDSVKYEAFEFMDADEQKSRREIDGFIETKSCLIYLEAKRGSNKHNPQQLVTEYKIGSKKAAQRKSRFVLIAIDENITEPSVIETVRSSAYAGIKRDQIKWVSWHEITDFLSKKLNSTAFSSDIERNIFAKRVNRFREQGFRSFEGFSKSDLAVVSRGVDFFRALDTVNTEIYNLIKGIQIAVQSKKILRAYKIAEHWRKRNNSRRKFRNNQYYIFWEQLSVGIGHKLSTIPRSYTFPFVDAAWTYDLSRDTLPHYLFVRFDLDDKQLQVGYHIARPRNVKQFFQDDKKVLKALKKFSGFRRKPLMVQVPKSPDTDYRASQVGTAELDVLKKGSSLDLYFSFGILDENLLEVATECLTQMREMVVSSDLVPKSEDKSETEHIQVEQVTVKEELTSIESAPRGEPNAEADLASAGWEEIAVDGTVDLPGPEGVIDD